MFLHAKFSKFLALAACLLVSSSLFAQTKIAITQITSHESLDRVYEGITDQLQASGYNPNSFEFANAQGDIATAVQIATRFASINPDVIVAIATPSAQAAAKAVRKLKTPVVFASVSDPLDAKLVKSLQSPGVPVTGTRNITPVDKQVQLMVDVIPEIQRVGVVINHSEANSLAQLDMLKKACKHHNIEVITAQANDSSMVSQAAASIVKKVDCFYLQLDNTVASALPGLLKVTNQNNIPVISSFVEAVPKGALIGIGVDEYQIGIQTGKMVARILKGEDPTTMPVEDPATLRLEINRSVQKSLNLKLDQGLINKADKIYP